jgi:hypothetical protein
MVTSFCQVMVTPLRGLEKADISIEHHQALKSILGFQTRHLKISTQASDLAGKRLDKIPDRFFGSVEDQKILKGKHFGSLKIIYNANFPHRLSPFMSYEILLS